MRSPESVEMGFSTLQKSPMRANRQPQFFRECLAFLEALEELFEDADHYRIHADAFGFGPILELEPGFGAYVEKLRVGQIHAGLAGLHDFYLFSRSPWFVSRDCSPAIAFPFMITCTS